MEPYSYTYQEIIEKLPLRTDNSHKGTYGKLLLIAGSKNMAGAAYFAAKAAYRSGTGLVYVYTTEENRVILQQLIPEAVLITYIQEPDLRQVKELMQTMSAVAIGPGLGKNENFVPVLQTVLNGEIPVVADADALNLCSEYNLLREEHRQDLIVTPHPLEMARMAEMDVRKVTMDLIGTAVDFSKRYQVITVLKDHHTIVTDGKEIYRNQTGNHGMATGGSGDVLTGVIGGMLAQRVAPFEAAKIGVYLHGLAGDLAARERGARSVMAGDIAEKVMFGL